MWGGKNQDNTTTNKCNASAVSSGKNCYKCSMTLSFENLASTLSCYLKLRPVSWARWFSSKFLSHFCRLHVRVCCKFTEFLLSHLDFSTDLLPAEYPSINIWEIHKYHPLLPRGQHAVAFCANTVWRMICWNAEPFLTLILWCANILGWIKLIKKLLQNLRFRFFFIIC